MGYIALVFVEGEILTAAKLNQILENIRSHVHGSGEVGSRVAKITIQPEQDPPAGSYLMEFRRADGTVVGSGTIEGDLSLLQLESSAASGTAPLIITSSALVSNLNAELWNGKRPSDLIWEAPALPGDKLDWDDPFFQNLGGSLVGDGTFQTAVSTTFPLSELRRQFIRSAFAISSGDGTAVDAKVEFYNSSAQLIQETDIVSTTSTTYVSFNLYSDSLLTGNSVDARFGETIEIRFLLRAAAGNTAYWDYFNAHFTRPFVTGRLQA
jgi:hypothetical protein